ncbi:MAG: hypothetical protein AAGA56_25455 [Myxococcota bacterium]
MSLAALGCNKDRRGAAESPQKRATAGYPTAQNLVPLLRFDNPRLVETADLIARAGAEDAQRAASERLSQLAETLHQPMSGAAGMDPTLRQRAYGWRYRQRVRVYNAMKALGREPALGYCQAVVEDASRDKAEQRLAYGVLATHGRVDKSRRAVTGVGVDPSSSSPGAQLATTSTSWGVQGSVAGIEGGQIDDVVTVFNQLQPYYSRCFQAALQAYGRFGAWVSLDAGIGAYGRVEWVRTKGEIPVSMHECLKTTTAQAQFRRPRQGKPVLSLALTFVPPAPAPAATRPTPANVSSREAAPAAIDPRL